MDTDKITVEVTTRVKYLPLLKVINAPIVMLGFNPWVPKCALEICIDGEKV